MKEKIIMLADMQSFYASVERAAHPEYRNKPLVVAGDPARRSGIVLAACPIAKSYGVSTAMRLGEAYAACPELIVIKPHMQHYIDVSMSITEIFERFTDLVEPFSIDEQFVDVTGSLRLFGSPIDIAKQIQQRVMITTGVKARIGISSTKVLAKTACDNFAKKHPDGIFTLPKEQIADILWPLEIHNMYMMGSRMTRHFNRMGFYTIGDLARTPLGTVKQMMRSRMGKQSDIQAELYWRIANGIDGSPVKPTTFSEEQKAYGNMMTLPRDYATEEEINIVLLEMCEQVSRRLREKGIMGWSVSAGWQGADFDLPTGFSGQKKLPDPTNISAEVYRAAQDLFRKNWNGLPIRRVGVSVTQLVPDGLYQLTMLDDIDRERTRKLEQATDWIKMRYGDAAILRAGSASQAGQAKERATKIGGHSK